MSLPEHASSVAPVRVRPLGRVADFAVAHPIALGVTFLLLCGWKFVFGLAGVMDIDVDHETAYLDYLLGSYSGPVPSEYSPLYVALYAVEHWFARDPIDLFYLNMTVLTLALPLSFFLYLLARRVSWLLALPVSAYLLIAMANLPARPKMMHLALIVVFLSLALFVRLGDRAIRWGLLLVVCGALSLIRPELLYALIAVGAWCLYLLLSEPRQRGPLAGWLALGAVATGGLYWTFGVPLFGERSVFALAWHFSANYLRWHGQTGGEAFAGDYWAIYHSVFGDAASIPAAFLANPPAFLHHIFTNLVRAPVVMAGDFLFHYNLFVPRYRGFTIVEGVLFAALLATALVFWSGPLPVGDSGGPRGWRRSIPTLGSGIRALAAECPETILLLLFAAPYPVMILLLYPRHHYVLMTGASLLAFALVAFGRNQRAPLGNRRQLLLLPLLLACVPSLGSVGVLLNRPYGEAVAAPRPALAEAMFLRNLHLTGPVIVFEASDPGISPYVAPNFRSLSEMEKPNGVAAFLRDRNISIVLEDDRLRLNDRFSHDAEWGKFRATPAAFGFEAKPVPDADAVIYIKQGLERGAVVRVPGVSS